MCHYRNDDDEDNDDDDDSPSAKRVKVGVENEDDDYLLNVSTHTIIIRIEHYQMVTFSKHFE